ncbi:hypothetical protein RRG08_051038 [Elysia crispata]|uniref:Uncharacterized protein n=1 Tax=Elysia crispata TaxID=231223 RepID=A0AAE1DAM1_9GAST|nr:hypothetical protein RRG08_051038 [Elysia crispata]
MRRASIHPSLPLSNVFTFLTTAPLPSRHTSPPRASAVAKIDLLVRERVEQTSAFALRGLGVPCPSSVDIARLQWSSVTSDHRSSPGGRTPAEH